jgi:hypothetical protein
VLQKVLKKQDNNVDELSTDLTTVWNFFGDLKNYKHNKLL